MKKKFSIKPEDLLIEENISGSSFFQTNENEDPKTTGIASEIYSFLTSDQSTLTEGEKAAIKAQIRLSINRLKWKRSLIRVSAAAAILIICTLTGLWYTQINSNPQIETVVQTLSQTLPNAETRLILQDGQEVKIDKAESEINYDQNGENITIGKDKKVTQNILKKQTSFNTLIVPYGKRTFITLSDGTKVWLNSGTKLIYPAVFKGNRREVYINGEAVFEVTHSGERPFYVKTRDFDVKVLGTVFSVSSYEDDMNSSAILERGKIEMCQKGKLFLTKNKITILPGTRAVFDSEKKDFTRENVNPHDYMSWHEGYLIFHHEKLCSILKKLTRYYNVEIDLSDQSVQNETFSGYLDLKNTPLEVLDIIAQTTPFVYRTEKNKICINP